MGVLDFLVSTRLSPESPVQPSLSRYMDFVTHPIGTCAVILESLRCIFFIKKKAFAN